MDFSENIEAGRVAPGSKTWAADTPVISPSFQERPPVFGDDIWDLRGLVHRANAGDGYGRIDFTVFVDPFRRITAKEIAMQRLTNPVVPSRKGAPYRRLTVHTVKVGLSSLGEAYDFIDASGIPDLKHLGQSELDAFLRKTQSRGMQPKSLSQRLQIFNWLFEARELLTYDWIAIPPWGNKPISRVLNIARGDTENRTPRIPEVVIGPLLRWALLYVEEFSKDILAAYYAKIEYSDGTIPGPRGRKTRVRERLATYIERLRDQGRGVPGRTSGRPGPNIRYICREIACAHVSMKQCGDLLQMAVKELGIDTNLLDSSVSYISGAGTTWRPGFTLGEDVIQECRRLMAACYIICAFLSGMRDSEVQAMKKGCYQPSRDADGQIIRHKVVSTQYKGKIPEGEERTWVVIEPVARAIEILEQLTERTRLATGSDYLFIIMQRQRSRSPTLKSMPNAYIQNFISYVNDVLHHRLASLGIPPICVGEQTVRRVTTRMFRRTVAWYIANQPFGVVAGMIQYDHVKETVFEGYAGTAESGFPMEVEAEREMARIADIGSMYEDAKRGIRPAGPMAAELIGEFERIREELDDLPGKVVDERRRQKMLHHLGQNLFPGLLADCFFEGKSAACLRHLAEGERAQPINGICDPNCRNACWRKKHLPAWESALADVERLAKRNRISPIQRRIVRAAAAKFRSVIASIREASNGH